MPASNSPQGTVETSPAGAIENSPGRKPGESGRLGLRSPGGAEEPCSFRPCGAVLQGHRSLPRARAPGYPLSSLRDQADRRPLAARKVLLTAVALLLVLPEPAQAYIGTGAVFSVLSSVLVIFVALLSA